MAHAKQTVNGFCTEIPTVKSAYRAGENMAVVILCNGKCLIRL